MAVKRRITSQPDAETAVLEESMPSAEEQQERADTEDTADTFIYIGPTLSTGIRENAVFFGTRESVEKHLADAAPKYPQVKTLLFPTSAFAKVLAKVKTPGTIYNKYFNDILSLQKKEQEG